MNTSFKKMRTILSILLISLISGSFAESNAQQYDEDYTLKYINSKLDGKCEVFAEKKNIRVEYKVNGELARVDYIFPESIDFEKGIYYSENEGAVIVTCYEKAGKCIERDIVKRDSKFLYDRTNLTTSCSENCNGLEAAVKHLVMLYVLDDVSRTEPFE